MFYEPDKNNHGLPFNPYKSIVVPRPVGWISTISRHGVVNLAPYSQFNNLGYDPPYVMFSANSFPESGRRKDSAKNATDTGEFVVNMATYELREAVNLTSQFVGPEVDEATLAGLEIVPSKNREAAPGHRLPNPLGVQIALRGGASRQYLRASPPRRHRSRRWRTHS